jgi:hypothetical protein
LASVAEPPRDRHVHRVRRLAPHALRARRCRDPAPELERHHHLARALEAQVPQVVAVAEPVPAAVYSARQ